MPFGVSPGVVRELNQSEGEQLHPLNGRDVPSRSRLPNVVPILLGLLFVAALVYFAFEYVITPPFVAQATTKTSTTTGTTATTATTATTSTSSTTTTTVTTTSTSVTTTMTSASTTTVTTITSTSVTTTTTTSATTTSVTSTTTTATLDAHQARPGYFLKNVQASRWEADVAASGSCDLPDTSYSVDRALVLGQDPFLGRLQFENSLCGQVLLIDCGNGASEAIIAGLSSDFSGVGLSGKTWDFVTDDQPVSVLPSKDASALCTLELTAELPMSYFTGPQCFFRPDIPYTTSTTETMIGLFNTGAPITSANINGFPCSFMENTAYLECYGTGFTDKAEIDLVLDDGKALSMSYGDCLIEAVHEWT